MGLLPKRLLAPLLTLSVFCWVYLFAKLTSPLVSHSAPGVHDTWRSSEADAAEQRVFFNRASRYDVVAVRAAITASASLGNPLSDADAAAAWHTTALERLNTSASSARATGTLGDPFIVYHASTWFGEATHKWLRGFHACPPRTPKVEPSCAISVYPSSFRRLWASADLALYHRAGGEEERVMPPPPRSRGNATRHTLFAAENFGSLFRASSTNRFDTELSFRRSGLMRDPSYEQLFLAGARASHDVLKVHPETWYELATARPLPNASSRFRAGLPPSRGALVLERREATVVFASSHCASHSGRESIVAALEEHIAVDVMGAGCLAAPWRLARAAGGGDGAVEGEQAPWAAQDVILSRYKFTLTFENALCADYVTEKIYQALARGSVPIIIGAPNVVDFIPAVDAVVDVRAFPSAAALAAYLRKLDNDDEAYNAFHAWRLRPWSTYGAALREYMERSLPLAEWGARTAAPDIALYTCGLCYALRDAGPPLADETDFDAADAARFAPRVIKHRAEGTPLAKSPVPPFQCAQPFSVADDEVGTFTIPPGDAPPLVWTSRPAPPTGVFARALDARIKERQVLHLPPPRLEAWLAPNASYLATNRTRSPPNDDTLNTRA